jgi:beta-glucosidase
MMDYDIRHGRTYMYAKEKPLYAFGYGLSYTSFTYESLSLSALSATAEGKIAVTVKVKNTGARASDEVVQMYVQHLGSGVERPHIELKGFERVYIEPGAEKNVVFELRPRDLAYWDTARQAWRIEKEPVRILAGGSSDELPVQAILQVEATGDYKP